MENKMETMEISNEIVVPTQIPMPMEDKNYLAIETVIIVAGMPTLDMNSMEFKNQSELGDSANLVEASKVLPLKQVEKNNETLQEKSMKIILLPSDDSIVECKDAVAKSRNSRQLSLRGISATKRTAKFTPLKKRQSARLAAKSNSK